jgi:dUTP pyrophosphatase
MRQFLIKVAKPSDVGMYVSHVTYHKGDAGLDLFMPQDVVIQSGETKLVDLGVRCQSRSFVWNMWKWRRGKFWNYHSYWLMPRSSISKTPLLMHNSMGLIDKGYTGTLKVSLFNMSEEPYHIKRGQRFAQLVNGDLSEIRFEVVEYLDIRNIGTRGEAGFGSTGY